MEKTMLRSHLTIAAILAIGSLVSANAQAAPTASRTAIAADSSVVAVHYTTHAKRHHHVVRDSNEITSFSSSAAPAALNVGVNHPPKK
jgi:predicted lysophospholipase L1 biosynthesis ABC-type transport system permease subunit